MIELNSTTQNAFDILSLIYTTGTPAESTNSLSQSTQGFGSILTEMIGSAVPMPSAASLTVAGSAESTNSSAANAVDLSAILSGTTGSASTTGSAAMSQVPSVTDLTAPVPAQSTNLSAALAQSVNLQQSAPAATPVQQNPAQLQPAAAQAEAGTPPSVPGVSQTPVQPPASDNCANGSNDQKAQEADQQSEEDSLKALTSQDSQKSSGTQKADKTQKAQDPQATQPNPMVFVPFIPVVAPSVMIEQKPVGTQEVQTQQQQKSIDPAAASVPVSAPVAVPLEMQRVWADLKKFELTVRNETARPVGANVQPQLAPAEAPKQAIVTTDPMANIQLQQLPPRINAIEKLVPEMTPPDRAKGETTRESNNTSTASPTMPFSDAARGVEVVEQARAAHQVEIPQIPHVQVVRTVSMEVGDAGSQVTVRIQERGGDISMQINTANEPLRQDLQSSVGSLVQALKQEQVPVSNVEVSRKSPIDKVRRMKEAN